MVQVDETRTIMHQEDDYAPVAYLKFVRWHLVSKTEGGDTAAPDIVIVSDQLIEDRNLRIDSEDARRVVVPQTVEHRDMTHYIPAFSLLSSETKAEMNGRDENNMSVQEEMRALLGLLQDEMKRRKLEFSSVSFVSLYLHDMSNFADVNEVYSNFFPLR